MMYVKTYEGFFGKVRDVFRTKEDIEKGKELNYVLDNNIEDLIKIEKIIKDFINPRFKEEHEDLFEGEAMGFFNMK